MIVPVILSGGAGTRLWPESTAGRPKQLLALTGDRTMLQATAGRVSAGHFAPPLIVANMRHVDAIEAQLAAIGVEPGTLLLEPVGRSTAPAIALAALAAGGDATLLVMPSDHLIADTGAFADAIAAGLPLAEAGWLCTLGIRPDRPETAYGWIRIDERLAPGVHRAGRFVEKPPRDRAEAMLAAGDHVWNAGIFLFRAQVVLDALASHAPAILRAAEAAMAAAVVDGRRLCPDREAFLASPSASIDYAVMEKADRVAVVPVSMGWNDIGSWDALYDVSAVDAEGNACSGDVLALDTRNCLVRSDGSLRVRMLGLSDLIVIASGNELLLLPRGRSQEVKRLIEAAEERDAAAAPPPPGSEPA
jgi:mannose-1-phosphate guanylyltransferase/mannose-1-phosphate guanylyltransferase/mannose-6-phosphate isomerase